MIRKNIVELDADVELKRIHLNLDTAFAQLIEKIENAKALMGDREHLMTRDEIELETKETVLSLNRWSLIIGVLPFLLALLSFGSSYIGA